jgi:hypothetical protein
LLSTSVLARASSRTTSSVRSVSSFDARFGHAIHSPAALSIRARSAGIASASSFRLTWNARIMSASPSASTTPSGRSASANPSGASTSSSRLPGLMPSFFGSGVPL